MNYLTKDSVNLLNKVNKDLKFKISKNSYFIELKNKFLEYYLESNIIKSIEIQKINYSENDDSKFIGKSLKNKMSKLKYSYKVNYQNIELYFITNKTDKYIKNKLINKVKIIYSLKKLFNRSDANQTVVIYDVNEMKKLPNKNNDTIGPGHCNSGYCSVLYDKYENGKIVLYRQEEIIKVLIHESIHANFIDYNIIVYQHKFNISKKICTHYEILLNEAFTETLASLINMILVNYYTKIDIDKIFNNEVFHMIYIFNKIMNYYNINKIEDIIEKNGCRRYFKQKTNVFSYYVLKTINYVNINKYLKLLKKYSNNNYQIINPNYNNDYISFVFKEIYQMNKYIKKEEIKNRNLKLSFYELKI